MVRGAGRGPGGGGGNGVLLSGRGCDGDCGAPGWLVCCVARGGGAALLVAAVLGGAGTSSASYQSGWAGHYCLHLPIPAVRLIYVTRRRGSGQTRGSEQGEVINCVSVMSP